MNLLLALPFGDSEDSSRCSFITSSLAKLMVIVNSQNRPHCCIKDFKLLLPCIILLVEVIVTLEVHFNMAQDMNYDDIVI